VKKPKLQPVPPPPQPEPEPQQYDDEDGWADPPIPARLGGEVVDDIAQQVIDLLDLKHIAYDISIEGGEGVISANSFNEKDLLKATGFRWSPDSKRWIFKFSNEQ